MEPHEYFLDKVYMENAIIIEHELHGITPEMVDWWFDNIDNSERYRLWHPEDHISFKWIVPPTQSHVGAECLIEEYVGGHKITVHFRYEDPSNIPAEYKHVFVASNLNENGEVYGAHKHEYEETPYGTKLRSTFPRPPDDPKWITEGLIIHNREEMQRFTVFLPDLFKKETSTS